MKNSTQSIFLALAAITILQTSEIQAAEKKKSNTSTSRPSSTETYSGSSSSGSSSSNSSSNSSSSFSTYESNSYGGAKRELGLSATDSVITNANNSTNISLNGDYKHTIAPGMQVGGLLNMTIQSGSGASNTYMGLWGSFTFNFNKSWDVSDSMFATAALGLVDEALSGQAMTSATSEKKISYLAYFGKRFTLFNRINYAPQGGFRKIGDSDMAIIIMPVNFSILF